MDSFFLKKTIYFSLHLAVSWWLGSVRSSESPGWQQSPAASRAHSALAALRKPRGSVVLFVDSTGGSMGKLHQIREGGLLGNSV